MKALVVGGNKGHWNYKQMLDSDNNYNGVETWAFALEGDYIDGDDISMSFLEFFDLIIFNLNFDKTKYMKKLREYLRIRNKKQKIAILIENDLLIYSKFSYLIVDLLNKVDLVITINPNSDDFFKTLTNTRIKYIGIPFNLDKVKLVRKQIKKKEIIVANSPLNRINEIALLNNLKIKHTTFIPANHRKLKAIFTNIKKGIFTLEKDYYKKLITDSIDTNFTDFIYYMSIKPYLELLSNYSIMLNLDERYTWARNVLDCAALQIPCISTANTLHAKELFPELIVTNLYDFENTKKLLYRLLEDSSFYDSNCNINEEYLLNFSYFKLKEKLINSF